MELKVARAAFDLPSSLPAKPDARLEIPSALMSTPFGTFQAWLAKPTTRKDSPDGEPYVGVCISNEGGPSGDLPSLCASMHLVMAAPARAGTGGSGSSSDSSGAAGAEWVSGWRVDFSQCQRGWAAGYNHGVTAAIKYSDLRAAAAAGRELRAVLAYAPAGALGAGAALRVPSQMGRLLAEGLLGEPLSDIALKCGGERFAAHRAVLGNASRTFFAGLTSGMADSSAGEVEIKETDPAALGLLLRHMYGAAVDVPLALAPQLCGLADRFQLRTDLAEQLTLWLSTVDDKLAELCELMRAAPVYCPRACFSNLYMQAAGAIEGAAAHASFGGWPLEAVAESLEEAEPASALRAAAAWLAAQPPPAAAAAAGGAAVAAGAAQASRWREVLAKVDVSGITPEQLAGARRGGGGGGGGGALWQGQGVLNEILLDMYEDTSRDANKGPNKKRRLR